MANFLASQIIAGNTTYTVVVTKYPQHKIVIDAYLTGKCREDLITA